jgi:hypothetical protein
MDDTLDAREEKLACRDTIGERQLAARLAQQLAASACAT